jgi:macrolide transport system ATP-binding/permease protein
MTVARRIYRRLARAFPHEFKLAYGDEMMQLGEDAMEEIARKHGAAGLVRLIADIAIRLPMEYLSEMRQDMRYALRALIKSPGFALVGIVSMGLGIGLTTNVYSSRWALLTRELPGAVNAERLVIPANPVSNFYVEQYRAQKSLFSGVAAMQNGVAFSVGLDDRTDAKLERVFGQLVSADYFSVLGVEAQRGRVLSPELDRAGDAPVVVVSDRFWRDHLHASADAVGQTLRLNGQDATIVGITPRNFDGALSMNPSELFVPITVPAALAPELVNDVLHERNAKAFVALMCLAPGVTIDAAESALDGITRRLDVLDPAAPPQADKGKRVVLYPAGTRAPIPRNLRPVLVGFFVLLMGLVMTIACMNLATMLLARGSYRRKEFAIRLSVGAGRFRLVRQMVSEGIVLSVLGGIAGLGLAYGLSVLNAQIAQPAGALPAPNIGLDWRASVFAFVLSVVCGIGFSLAPALQATSGDMTPALKDSSALQLSGYRRFGLRNVAMVAQLTGSLMLLLITGFVVMGTVAGNRIDTRVDAKTTVLLSIDPVRDGYTAEKAQDFFEKLPERLRTSGMVGSVALAAQPPFVSLDPDDGDNQLTAEEPRLQKVVVQETVGPGYFAAFNEPVPAGREFTELDQRIAFDASKAATLPVVVNESAARAFWGNGNAIGKRVRSGTQTYEVIGVVRDLKDVSGITQAIVYEPLTRRDFARPAAGGITLIVRADGRTDALNAMRRAIAGIDPKLTLFNAQTLGEYLETSRVAMRAALRTYEGIGVFGLILSAIGLAGVTAYAVAQRRREIGIRMALGARKGQVLRLVLREGTVLIAVGTVLGLAGAVVMAKMLSAVTSAFADAFRIGTNDPRLLVGAPLLLAGVCLLACYLPARRAAEVDPVKALRQE